MDKRIIILNDSPITISDISGEITDDPWDNMLLEEDEEQEVDDNSGEGY